MSAHFGVTLPLLFFITMTGMKRGEGSPAPKGRKGGKEERKKVALPRRTS